MEINYLELMQEMHLCHGTAHGTGTLTSEVTIETWMNRDPPQGYKVVHIKFSSGRPVHITPFLFYSAHGTVGSESAEDTGPGTVPLWKICVENERRLEF
jgi:hypothetical protein